MGMHTGVINKNYQSKIFSIILLLHNFEATKVKHTISLSSYPMKKGILTRRSRALRSPYAHKCYTNKDFDLKWNLTHYKYPVFEAFTTAELILIGKASTYIIHLHRSSFFIIYIGYKSVLDALKIMLPQEFTPFIYLTVITEKNYSWF